MSQPLDLPISHDMIIFIHNQNSECEKKDLLAECSINKLKEHCISFNLTEDDNR